MQNIKQKQKYSKNYTIDQNDIIFHIYSFTTGNVPLNIVMKIYLTNSNVFSANNNNVNFKSSLYQKCIKYSFPDKLSIPSYMKWHFIVSHTQSKV